MVLMDQALFMWVSIVVIFAMGSLAHFLYEIAHHNKVIGLFTAVNESTWEHVKIAITPTLLWSLLDGFFFGTNPNYFTAKLASLLILTFFIPMVYYSYRRVAKHSILPIDITIFAVAIILAQMSFFAIIEQPAIPYWATYISAVATFVFFGAYMTLTLYPLRNIIFKDPITGKYGFLAHRDLFKSAKKHKQD